MVSPSATPSWPARIRQRLDALPRDSRDTLFLLLVVGWILLPLVGALPLWASALTAGVLLWRAGLAWRARPLPGRWWLAALLLLALAGTVFTHQTLLGRDAGLTLITMLLALKTLELRARRDTLVVFFLGFFAMLTNFFFSQTLLVAAAMVVGLLGLLTALVNTHMPVDKPPLWQAARTAGTLMLFGTPVMVALFVLFPRIGPLWGTPSDQTTGRSGLSSSMQVGSMARLALDESIALRVRFDLPGNTTPPSWQLYFRGPVLGHFDGREWRSLSAPLDGMARLQPPAQLQVNGPGVSYQVTMEPSQQAWVLTMDAAPLPPDLPGRTLRMAPDLQWFANRPISELVRYQATSYPDFRHGPLQKTPALRVFTELPAGYNPRTLQLAAEMRQDPALAQADTPALVEAVLQRLRTGGYTYTLEPGLYGQHTADEFWFDRKEGFCEHIASSFVVLMRALDIPARIVTGYQGGDRNAVDGVWTLRQSDAHAWAEVWQAGQGWVRVDPTAAVAPGRVGTAGRLPAPRGVVGSAFDTVLSPTLLATLRATWEAANNGWNQWVLNYTQGSQIHLLKKLGFTAPSGADLVRLLAGLVAAVALAAALWARWERSRQDPWLRLLDEARQRLRRAGLPLGPAVPARSMAQAVQQHFGVSAAPLSDWLLRLESFRYARGSENTPHTSRMLATLRREFSQLPWPPKR